MLFDVFLQDDTPELLASDVHIAGAGMCNDSAVMKLAREGPQRVEEMLLSGTAEVSEYIFRFSFGFFLLWMVDKTKP